MTYFTLRRTLYTLAFPVAALLLVLAAPRPAAAQGVTVHSGATLTVANDATLGLGGAFTNSGTFDATGGAVAFVGSGNQSFAPGASVTLRALVVDQASPGTVQLGHPVAVTDSVLVLSGVLDLNAQQIDLGTTGGLRERAGQTVIGPSGGTITATRTLSAPDQRNVAGLGV